VDADSVRRAKRIAGRIALRERYQARKTTTLTRTVKSCGPDASLLASSLAEARSAQPGRAKPSIREATVAKKPIAGESTKEAVKTIACGNAGLFR